jgi:hypothetical protein
MPAETGAPERTEALEQLSRRLYEVMEQLDPSQVSSPWEEVPDHERAFYRACIRGILSERGLLSLLLRCEDD